MHAALPGDLCCPCAETRAGGLALPRIIEVA
jgi:hypothetical protein